MKFILKTCLCLPVFVCTMASGMQNQQIPQDLQAMLQQHKDLTLKNRKIAKVIKFINLEALILADAYILLSVIPRLDAKLLGGKLLRAIKANGNFLHDIKGLGIILAGACCFSIAATGIGSEILRCLNYLIKKLPGERRQRELENTIAQRANQFTRDQLYQNFQHFDRYVDTIGVPMDFGTNLGARLWRLYASKRSQDSRDRIMGIVRDFGYPYP